MWSLSARPTLTCGLCMARCLWPLDLALAMRLLLCPSHFRPLARFLRACHAQRSEFVASRRSPLPPELDLPLDLHLLAAVALPGLWARLLACPALVGCFVLCLFVVPVLVGARWLSLRSVK